MNISHFINQVKKWSNEMNDIDAVLLVGSYARGDEKAQSDVDLVMITTNKEKYLQQRFFDVFGTVKNYQIEYYGRVTSIRVWYEQNQLEVEFGITTPIWIKKPLDDGTKRVLFDVYKIIVDKKNYFNTFDIYS